MSAAAQWPPAQEPSLIASRARWLRTDSSGGRYAASARTAALQACTSRATSQGRPRGRMPAPTPSGCTSIPSSARYLKRALVDGDQIPDETIDHVLTWLPGDAPELAVLRRSAGANPSSGGSAYSAGRLGFDNWRSSTTAHVP